MCMHLCLHRPAVFPKSPGHADMAPKRKAEAEEPLASDEVKRLGPCMRLLHAGRHACHASLIHTMLHSKVGDAASERASRFARC